MWEKIILSPKRLSCSGATGPLECDIGSNADVIARLDVAIVLIL